MVGVMAAPAFASPQLFCTYTVSGGSTTSVNLPSDCGGGSILSGGYHTIRMNIFGKCSSNARTKDAVTVQFNGDTGNNYQWQWFSPSGHGNGTSQQYGILGNLPCSTSTGSPLNNTVTAAGISVLMPGASSTVFKKQVEGITSIDLNNVDNLTTELWSSGWDNATVAAITSLKLELQNGSPFVSGTMFDLLIE